MQISRPIVTYLLMRNARNNAALIRRSEHTAGNVSKEP